MNSVQNTTAKSQSAETGRRLPNQKPLVQTEDELKFKSLIKQPVLLKQQEPGETKAQGQSSKKPLGKDKKLASDKSAEHRTSEELEGQDWLPRKKDEDKEQGTGQQAMNQGFIEASASSKAAISTPQGGPTNQAQAVELIEKLASQVLDQISVEKASELKGGRVDLKIQQNILPETTISVARTQDGSLHVQFVTSSQAALAAIGQHQGDLLNRLRKDQKDVKITVTDTSASSSYHDTRKFVAQGQRGRGAR